MTLNERVTKLEIKHITNKRSIANANLIMTALAFVMLLFAVGLITSTEHQQRQISELKTELKKKRSEIEKLQNRNLAQDIILEIARFASILRPQYLFLENVKGLLNHDRGTTFEAILRALDELGYDVEWRVLNSKDFGVPQCHR